jgi:hypothetical protein
MTRTVFLWHWMSAVALLWLYCWYHSAESKKARQMLKHLNELVRKLFNTILSQIG